jgi:glycosyltransferase involved in cell wall biosynthesis
MPVHNALPWLDAAIESILAQTHRDFAFAIYDDCSDDGSWERLTDWAARDPRIRLQRGNERLGPSGSSNAVSAMVETALIARMDADDVAMPERLAVQIAALAAHPAAVMTGSTFEVIDGNDRVLLTSQPGHPGRFAPAIGHSSTCYRRTALEAIGGYRASADYFEDHDLYRRIVKLGPILVLDCPLVKIRFAGQNHRLNDDRAAMLERISHNYRIGREPDNPRRPLAPIACYSIANLAMLGGRRPGILGLMLRRAELDWRLSTFGAYGFVALAELSPWLARRCWQVVSWLRQAIREKPTGGTHYWNGG